MSGGRTIWWAKDARWWARERIVELALEFGPGGPAVIDYLSGEAKLQNDGGRVKAGVLSVARGCFVEPETVRHVLSRSVTLGLLDEMEWSESRFDCRISGFAQDQSRGNAAFRKQDQRERETAELPVAKPNPERDEPGLGVTDRDLSRPVTPSHAESHTGEDSREDPPTPLRGITPEFSEWIAHHQDVTGHTPPPSTTKAFRSIVESFNARIAEGWTLEGLKAATVGAHRDDHRRENGYTTADSVLRPTKVGALASKGKQHLERAERRARSAGRVGGTA